MFFFIKNCFVTNFFFISHKRDYLTQWILALAYYVKYFMGEAFKMYVRSRKICNYYIACMVDQRHFQQCGTVTANPWELTSALEFVPTDCIFVFTIDVIVTVYRKNNEFEIHTRLLITQRTLSLIDI